MKQWPTGVSGLRIRQPGQLGDDVSVAAAQTAVDATQHALPFEIVQVPANGLGRQMQLLGQFRDVTATRGVAMQR
jgi:hypothetical protein